MSNADSIQRKELVAASVTQPYDGQVRAMEVTLGPGQSTGKHLHPCTTLTFILEGTAIVQFEGEEEQTYTPGSAVVEHANRVVLRYDNPSATEPLRFVAFYLMRAGDEIIRSL